MINKVTEIGNLTKDIELKKLPSGTSVINFTIAVNEKTKQGDQFKEYAHFFDCVCYGKLAENCAKYLSKGSLVGVSGRLRQSRWEKDNQKKRRIEIVIEDIQFL